MNELLLKLGLSIKQINVYLALLELGSQPASIIAKKVNLPKSTVLFICENLKELGYLQKSQQGKTQIYYAEPEFLEKAVNQDISNKKQALEKAMPLLKEFKSPFTQKPQLSFFEGVQGCKKAYLQLLDSKTEILEFGVHTDLEEKFGKKFMDNFIQKRIKANIELKGIVNLDDSHQNLAKSNKIHLREIQFLNSDKGVLYSSICIFDKKVLLLNLHGDAFAILIESEQVYKTLKTIFKASWQ